jgi:hypothetical protein
VCAGRNAGSTFRLATDAAIGKAGFANGNGASRMAGKGRERVVRWAGSFLIVLGVALLLGRLGPFDTFSELAPAARYAYWLGLTLLLWLQIEVCLRLLASHGGDRQPWWATAAAAALLASVPSAFEVAWAESFLRVERDLGPVDLLAIFGDVALIALPLALLLVRLRRPAALAPRPDADAPDAGLDRLQQALPPERRGAILALAAEDHYLRVFTDRGEALILKRFGDALADVAHLDGMRVHRSWWVARTAVAEVERDGDRLIVRLHDGVSVPVSRSYRLAVQEKWPISA